EPQGTELPVAESVAHPGRCRGSYQLRHPVPNRLLIATSAPTLVFFAVVWRRTSDVARNGLMRECLTRPDCEHRRIPVVARVPQPVVIPRSCDCPIRVKCLRSARECGDRRMDS